MRRPRRLGLVHLGVALSRLVPGGAGRGDDRRVHHRAGLRIRPCRARVTLMVARTSEAGWWFRQATWPRLPTPRSVDTAGVRAALLPSPGRRDSTTVAGNGCWPPSQRASVPPALGARPGRVMQSAPRVYPGARLGEPGSSRRGRLPCASSWAVGRVWVCCMGVLFSDLLLGSQSQSADRLGFANLPIPMFSVKSEET